MTRAAFVDRDGVINQLVDDPPTGLGESPLRPEDVAISPGAPEALARLRHAGWRLVGVSNQPAAAKGTASLERLQAVQARVEQLLASHGVRFDVFQICWHHPEGVVPELSGPCRCRKPAPGMLLDAAAKLHADLEGSWMIGDTDADVLAGRAARCKTALITNPRSAHKRTANAQADVTVPDLGAAADLLIDDMASSDLGG